MSPSGTNYRLSKKQRDRISEFLMDLTKLIIASILVPFFIPGSSGGLVSIPTFVVGVLFAIICFGFGVKLTTQSEV